MKAPLALTAGCAAAMAALALPLSSAHASPTAGRHCRYIVAGLAGLTGTILLYKGLKKDSPKLLLLGRLAINFAFAGGLPSCSCSNGPAPWVLRRPRVVCAAHHVRRGHAPGFVSAPSAAFGPAPLRACRLKSTPSWFEPSFSLPAVIVATVAILIFALTRISELKAAGANIMWWWVGAAPRLSCTPP